MTGFSLMTFLSTLSLRRATIDFPLSNTLRGDFYPRSPCGERHICHSGCPPVGSYFYPRSPCGERPDCEKIVIENPVDFYPRSPCGERLARVPAAADRIYFYPRSPCGERPPSPAPAEKGSLISIHALLAESDRCKRGPGVPDFYFYPRSPCGERPHIRSTSHDRLDISIHALLAESDPLPWPATPKPRLFLSTLSLRRATLISAYVALVPSISIHALLAESDRNCVPAHTRPYSISIHALLAESDMFCRCRVRPR